MFDLMNKLFTCEQINAFWTFFLSWSQNLPTSAPTPTSAWIQPEAMIGFKGTVQSLVLPYLLNKSFTIQLGFRYIPFCINTGWTSMTSLLTYTVAHSTRHSFRPKDHDHGYRKSYLLEIIWLQKTLPIMRKKFTYIAFNFVTLC